MPARPFLRLLAAVSILILASCASEPRTTRTATLTPPAAPLSEPAVRRAPSSDEIYTGPPAAAILPVIEGRASASPDVSRWWIQKVMAEELDRADVFAGVIPLETREEAHEADLVIQPALTALTWTRPDQRSGNIAMRVRATDAVSGQVRLDRVYTASCNNCRTTPGQPAVAGPVAAMMQDVIKDLARFAAR